jgi:hypothetical protein
MWPSCGEAVIATGKPGVPSGSVVWVFAAAAIFWSHALMQPGGSGGIVSISSHCFHGFIYSFVNCNPQSGCSTDPVAGSDGCAGPTKGE